MKSLKNRSFIITKNNKLYAYINVKKDFYVEGIIYENQTLITGYFRDYHILKCIIFENWEKCVNGISFKNSKLQPLIDIDNNIITSNFDLHDCDIDEYGYGWLGEMKDSNYSISLSTEPELNSKMDYLVRKSISSLNEWQKNVYQCLKNHRCGNLKEYINNIVTKELYVLTEDDKIMLMQLRDYLKVLQQEKERTINKEKPEKVVKNRKRKVKSKRKK